MVNKKIGERIRRAREKAPGPCSTISAQNSSPHHDVTGEIHDEGVADPARGLDELLGVLEGVQVGPQIPQARVRARTSPGPGSGRGTSATTSVRSRITAARMASPS